MGSKLDFLGLTSNRHILAVFFILLLTSCAGASVKIVGSVTDYETAEPVIGVYLQIAGANWNSVSDECGCFIFNDIPAGDYVITASHIGYFPAEKDIRVLDESSVSISINICKRTLELPEVTFESSAPGIRTYDADVIRSSAAEDLGTFLSRSGEVFIIDGGGSKEAHISIRGSKTEQIAVFLDGHRLNDPLTGKVDLKTIPLGNIDRIVVKSNADLTMGASSPGGMVVLYSTQSSDNSIKLGMGSFGYQNIGLQIAGEYKIHRLQFSFNRIKSDGDFPYIDANGLEKKRINDDYDNHNLFLKHTVSFDKSELSVSCHHFDSDRGAPGGIENPATLDRIDKSSDGLSVNFQTTGGKWANLTHVSYYSTNTTNLTHYFFGGDTLEMPSKHHTTAMEFDSKLHRSDSLGQSALGIAYRLDEVRSSTLAGQEDRRDLGLYLQRTVLFRPFRISNTIRFDDYRGYGNFISADITGRIGGILIEGFALTGGWSRNFNLPTFNQLFWAENAFSAPNPQLKPERAENWEAGLEFINGDFQARALYFHRYIKDLIIWQETFTSSGRKWKPVNTDAARISGIEINTSLDTKYLTFSAAATIADPRDLSEKYFDNFLVFQPQVQTSESIVLKRWDFHLTISHRYLSERYTLQANTKSVAPASIFDLSFGWILKYNSWEGNILLRIDNVFAERYSIIRESPMPGRSFTASLIIQLP